MRKKLKSLNNLGTICPTQWDGRTTNNEYIYIRYRFGNLTVERIGTTDQELLLSETFGSDLDGYMTTKTMMKETESVLDFEDIKGAE